MNKKLYAQIFWICTVSIIIFLVYASIASYSNEQNLGNIKKEKIHDCGKKARQYSLDQTKEFSKNPFLSDPEKITRAQTDFYIEYAKQCFILNNLIEGN